MDGVMLADAFSTRYKISSNRPNARTRMWGPDRSGARTAKRRGRTARPDEESMKTVFDAVIKIRNANPYILVSAVRANTIKSGWRKPMPVMVRVNGKPDSQWRINMMPVGNGDFYLYLHGDIRRASHTYVGDRVRIEINFDASYRNGPQHSMPIWFRQGLMANRRAKTNWLALTPSRKKESLRYFSRLKSPAARGRNLARALNVLSGAAGRFMGRTWADGS
jgi:Bacteriocin-protection, YdeI or OmpD-Associated/Domain of unknown function (DUF1905)